MFFQGKVNWKSYPHSISIFPLYRDLKHSKIDHSFLQNVSLNSITLFVTTLFISIYVGYFCQPVKNHPFLILTIAHFKTGEFFKMFWKLRILPVEYSVVQSSFLVEISSNWGSSMPLSTSRGICGSQMKMRSSVVCETAIWQKKCYCIVFLHDVTFTWHWHKILLRLLKSFGI